MIKVNEIFGPTIQGEGKSVGKQVVFLRLALCNLYCIWCDTPYTWNWEGTNFEHNDSKKYSKIDEIHEMTEEAILQKISEYNIPAVVLSGGEPLIQHKALTPLLRLLKEKGYWVEVETNGTIYPNAEFLELIDQINCSPKLHNSNNTRKDRERPKVLEQLAAHPKVNFKFVISDKRDTHEILGLVTKYNMKDVYLMPLGMTNEELNKTRQQTIDLCNQFHFKFSDRVHITQLGGGRGV